MLQFSGKKKATFGENFLLFQIELGGVVTRSFGLVDYKIQEAEFFLLEVHRHGRMIEHGAVQFCVSAFVSAARSVTFAMQASLKGHFEFDAWYAPRQEALRKDPLSRFFHEFRTVTQHIGENLVSGGSHSKAGTFYYFAPCRDLPSVPDLDVITACDMYFKSVLDLVYECYVHLRTVVDGQWYFTEENFKRMGKKIEDAEEELGMPRGWTDIKQPDTALHRWQLLRQNADGCNIQPQFQKWLGKQLERPPAPPPYFPAD